MNSEPLQTHLSDLRIHITALVRRWRLRRIGEELRRSFAAVEAGLLTGYRAAFCANLELIGLLEWRAPAVAAVVDPAIDSAKAMSRILGQLLYDESACDEEVAMLGP